MLGSQFSTFHPLYQPPFYPLVLLRGPSRFVFTYPINPAVIITYKTSGISTQTLNKESENLLGINQQPKKNSSLRNVTLKTPLHYNKALQDLVKGKSTEEIQDALKGHALIGREFDFLGKKALLITYPHGSENYSPVGRASRGTVLISQDGEWKVLRAMLPRMEESMASWALTKQKKPLQSIANGILLDSFSPNSLDRSWIASDKADGMLVTATVMDKEEIREEINRQSSLEPVECSSEMLAAFLAMADRLNLGYIPILGTQKAFPLSDNSTIDYVLTALFCSTAGVSEEEFRDQLKDNPSVGSLIHTYGEAFLRIINLINEGLKGKFESQDPLTLSFEAICRNREDGGGRLHDELTVSYDSASFVILAASRGSCDGIATVPHYQFSSLVKEAGLNEPRFWRFEDELGFTKFLEKIYEVTLGKLSAKAFNLMYPSLGHSVESHKVPAEGVICYKPGDPYGSKVKNEVYYLSHGLSRLKIDQAAKILNAGEKTSYFPEAIKFYQLFESISNRLERALRTCVSLIDPEIESAQPNHLEFNKNDCLKHYGYESFHQYLFSAVKDKTILNLDEKHLREKRLSMLFSSDLSVEFIWRIFQQEFPEMVDEKLIAVTDKWTKQTTNRFPKSFKTLLDYFSKLLKDFSSPNELVAIARSGLANYDSKANSVTDKTTELASCALFEFLIYLYKAEKPLKKVSIVDVFPFGNLQGRDLDVAVQVEGSVSGVVDPEEVRKLLLAKGISTNKKIDITLFARNSKGSIVASSKGSCVVLEWILYEAGYSPPCLKIPAAPDVGLMAIMLGKFISMNFDKITIPEIYKKFYEEKSAAWENGSWGLVEFAIKCQHQLNLIEDDKLQTVYNLRPENSERLKEIKEKHLSAIKGMTMKLVQLHLASVGQYTTQSDLMIERMASLFSEWGNKENFQYLLSRGEKGNYDPKTLPKMIQSFVVHCERIMPKGMVFNNLPIFPKELKPSDFLEHNSQALIDNPELYNQLIEEFMKNPNGRLADEKGVESDEPDLLSYLEELTKHNRSLNESFQLKSKNSNLLPESFQVEAISQRSYYWKERYYFYDCGVLNKGEDAKELENFQESTNNHFHLIRGTLGEIITLNAIENLIKNKASEFSTLIPSYTIDALVTVGLLVGTLNQKGSKGIPPDGLIRLSGIDNETTKWMPLEIKVYGKSKPSLRDLSRERDLAIKQLRSALSFFPPETSVEKGLLVELYCNDTGAKEPFTLKAAVVDFASKGN